MSERGMSRICFEVRSGSDWVVVSKDRGAVRANWELDCRRRLLLYDRYWVVVRHISPRLLGLISYPWKRANTLPLSMKWPRALVW